MANTDVSTLESMRDEITRRRLQMQKLHLAQRHLSSTNTNTTKPNSGDRSRSRITELSPFAVAILGMEGTYRPTAAGQQYQQREESAEATIVPESTVNVPVAPQARTTRRAQSHYNAFQTVCAPAQDDPPTYATAVRQRPVTGRSTRPGSEILPKYTCTVAAEAKLLVNLEAVNPLHTVSEGEWREVYIVVRGTMLSVHRIKDGGAGKLVRSYTLQHAEVGLATDSSHTILVPQSRLAHFIPTAARQKAFRKDPALFRPAAQTILRLRVESDQILLADSCEERIHEFINAISAGIDIAPSIDERSVSKQWTVPRRRRRPRPAFNGDVTDANAVAEQERILQQMYPAFAQEGHPASAQTTSPPQPLPTPAREEDEIDLSAMREDSDTSTSTSIALTPTSSPSSSHRPTVSRTVTTSTTASTATFADDMIHETNPQNFTAAGKWRPPHSRTALQIQRYTRRCLPILTADAARASDVCIIGGRRVKINWRKECLEEWNLQPPTYKSHKFDTTEANGLLARSASSSSSVPARATPASSQEELGRRETEDEIAPVSSGLAGLELAKTVSGGDKDVIKPLRSTAAATQMKAVDARRDPEVHGAMFCF